MNSGRHKAVPLGNYTQHREDALEKARAERARKPRDPEAALALLSVLVTFRKTSEADKVASELEHTFPNHAVIQFYVGVVVAFILEDGAPIEFLQFIPLPTK